MLHFLLIVIALLVIWGLLGPLAKAWTLIGGFVLLLSPSGARWPSRASSSGARPDTKAPLRALS
ncbi:hypothetical protein AWB68_05614 [Caballeronia choica]|uniref:Uncharacterized protein n=1 Tax=Caballeronia choica TaxID=326476 RepID=A0A158KE23_9BURK|nr:hypothetical protein AWB68_05614 [Caballeronia choica]